MSERTLLLGLIGDDIALVRLRAEQIVLTDHDGVTTIDTSDLDLPGSVEAVVQVVLARSGRTPQGAA